MQQGSLIALISQFCLDERSPKVSLSYSKAKRIKLFYVYYFMGRLGFEPRTIRLKAEYSTVELATRCLVAFLRPFSTVT